MDNPVAKELIKSSFIENIIDFIHCPADLYDQEFVNYLHSIGLQIHAGLCDTEEQLLKARTLGADELTTNNLDLALRVLKGT